MFEVSQYRQRRLSRRRALRVVAGGGAATALLVGCGRQEQAKRTPTTEPKRGGVLTHAGGPAGSFESRGVGLDPHTYLAVAGQNYRLFYQGLLGYNPRTYGIQPELAQKWEQPSQTEYIFTLQPGVKWHNKPPANGRELTVDDVVFSLERARTDNPRFYSRSILTAVDTIEAVDRTTVRLTTRQPDATTLSKLSADVLLVLAPEVVERAGGRFATAETAVGTGAFIMKSLEEQVGAEYVRNPDYWKPGLPYLDGLRTVHLPDEQAAWAAFLAGKVDIARLSGTEVKVYVAQQGPNYTPDWFKDNTVIILQPNAKAAPMNDPRVTRALRLLLDHDEWKTAWAEVWFGRGRHGSIFPTALDTWDLTEEEYTRHLEWKQPKDEAAREALALLNAAGFTRANPLRFELTGRTDSFAAAANEVAQAQWKRLGQGVVDVQINQVDIAVANQLRARRQFTYLIHGNVAGTTEPDSWLSEIYHSRGSANFMNFSDPKVDEMIDRQRTLFDLQQRKALVREMVLYLIDHCPGVVGSNRLFLNAVKPQVRNYTPEFHIHGAQYETVWLDT